MDGAVYWKFAWFISSLRNLCLIPHSCQVHSSTYGRPSTHHSPASARLASCLFLPAQSEGLRGAYIVAGGHSKAFGYMCEALKVYEDAFPYLRLVVDPFASLCIHQIVSSSVKLLASKQAATGESRVPGSKLSCLSKCEGLWRYWSVFCRLIIIRVLIRNRRRRLSGR